MKKMIIIIQLQIGPKNLKETLYNYILLVGI